MEVVCLYSRSSTWPRCVSVLLTSVSLGRGVCQYCYKCVIHKWRLLWLNLLNIFTFLNKNQRLKTIEIFLFYISCTGKFNLDRPTWLIAILDSKRMLHRESNMMLLSGLWISQWHHLDNYWTCWMYFISQKFSTNKGFLFYLETSPRYWRIS